MKIHELKTDKNLFIDLLEGRKKFEIRLNDRNFGIGDYLLLKETGYTGREMKAGSPLVYLREILVKVRYILRGPIYGLQDGWVIMSITEPL